MRASGAQDSHFSVPSVSSVVCFTPPRFPRLRALIWRLAMTHPLC
jgi:hypothetical protein